MFLYFLLKSAANAVLKLDNIKYDLTLLVSLSPVP